MKIVIPSYSGTYWCLKPFAYLFNKYWEMQDPVILHYPKIPFDLPKNFELHQIYYKDYPMEKWADGVIEYLEKINDEVIILLLEDYWLVRKVNIETISILEKLIRKDDSIIRIDLTADRLYAGGMRDVGYVEWIDLIEAPQSMYQMSLQAGMWDRLKLLDVLHKLGPTERSSWSVELVGTGILNNDTDYRVLGTRQYPLRYENGVNARDGVNHKLPTMCQQDKDAIHKWIEDK